MGRPRTKNLHLPPRMTLKRGVHYYIGREGGKQVWTSLGKDYEEALAQYRLLDGSDADDAKMEKASVWVPAVYDRSKRQAILRAIPFDLTLDEFQALVKYGKNRCAVTGIPFDFATKVGSRRPWAPSLDRIDSRLGYSFQNCRLVCYAVNVALSDWGTAVFERMARSFVDYAPPALDHDSAPKPVSSSQLESAVEKLHRARGVPDTLARSPLSDEYWAKRLQVPVEAVAELRLRMKDAAGGD